MKKLTQEIKDSKRIDLRGTISLNDLYKEHVNIHGDNARSKTNFEFSLKKYNSVRDAIEAKDMKYLNSK